MKISSVAVNGKNIPLSAINLMVGANNTGKSTLLREIHGAITNGYVNEKESRWLDSARVEVTHLKDEINSVFGMVSEIPQIDKLESRQAAEVVGFLPFRQNVGQSLKSYRLAEIIKSNTYDANNLVLIDIPKLMSAEQLSKTLETRICKFLVDIGVLAEYCDSRLAKNFSTNISDILQGSEDQSPVRHLRENPKLLAEIQKDIHNVFGVMIGFDDLQQGQKPLRILTKKRYSTLLDQKNLATLWQSESPTIDSQGDGLCAYLKLAFSLLDPYSKIIFVDEPETFLHPPQRKSLGNLIAKMAKQYGKQVFIATHDAEFIRGLLNYGNEVKVLNLKLSDEKHTVTEIDLKDIKAVLEQRGNRLKERADILNEAILNTLFFGKTILTESENDRVFYEYYSALRHNSSLQDKCFIGFRNIDEVLIMMGKLNGIGINASCIVDIDFLVTRYSPSYIKHENPELHNAHVAIRQSYDALPDVEKGIFLKNLKCSGLKAINDASQRKQYEYIINAYCNMGIYVPKVGGLESWTQSSKNNLSQMVRKIEERNPRELNKFMKVVLS